MLYLSFNKHFFSSRFQALLGFLSQRSVDFWIPSIMRPPDKLPDAVSIDEFKGNTSTRKYQCILVDPQKHQIPDIVPNRTQSHLADYWRSIPRKESLKVKFFVYGMWLSYVELARTFFPRRKDYRR